jgi:hypothetical protein
MSWIVRRTICTGSVISDPIIRTMADVKIAAPIHLLPLIVTAISCHPLSMTFVGIKQRLGRSVHRIPERAINIGTIWDQ